MQTCVDCTVSFCFVASASTANDSVDSFMVHHVTGSLALVPVPIRNSYATKTWGYRAAKPACTMTHERSHWVRPLGSLVSFQAEASNAAHDVQQ
jgi:hypothetical protein